MKKIIAFSGSNSSKSINQKLATIAAGYVKNVEVEILDLRDYEAPLYGIDLEEEQGIPAGMKELSLKFASADGFIVSSPEHNGSMPAVLKNTIDWLSRIEQKVFGNKPTLFLSTSPGPRGGISALQHLVTIMPFRGANVVGGISIGSFQTKVENNKIIGKEGEELELKITELEALINS